MFRGISKNLKKGFEFEEAWLLWEDYGAVVKDAWEMVVEGGGGSRVWLHSRRRSSFVVMNCKHGVLPNQGRTKQGEDPSKLA